MFNHPYCSTIWYLLLTDLQIYKRTIIDKIINLHIWITTSLLVTAYLLPSFGLSNNYAHFILPSLVASVGLFEVFPTVVNMVTDFDGDRITNFYLTLPMPSYLVFVKHMIFYAINIGTMASFILPIGKVLLWNSFSFQHFNPFKFLIIFLLMCSFYATFAVWTASKLASMEKIQNLWMRFIFPLWFLGCYQYSWTVLYKTSPLLAYATLFNPIMYIMEGMRAAVLGQDGFLNFWLCAIMAFVFTILCGWQSIRNMKQRLDF